MAGFKYHSPDELYALGVKIRDKAIKVTMDQADSYAQAQQSANNDATRASTGQQPLSLRYTPPAQGRPDDDGNLRAYVTGAYDGIPLLFTQFGMPNPADAQPTLDALYQAAVTVEPSLQIRSDSGALTTPLQTGDVPGSVPVEETVNIITTHLKQWEGDAADAFEIYIKDLKSSTARQRELILSLAAALEAQLSIRRAVLTDIWEIGNKTLKALEQLEGWCPSTDAAKTQAVLTIGGAIAAVVFVGLSTGGTGAAIATATAVEGLQSVASILGAVPALKTAPENIGGATVPPILTGMANAINKLNTTLNQQQQEVVRALQALGQSLDRIYNHVLLPAPGKLTSVRGASRSQLEKADGFYVRD